MLAVVVPRHAHLPDIVYCSAVQTLRQFINVLFEDFGKYTGGIYFSSNAIMGLYREDSAKQAPRQTIH